MHAGVRARMLARPLQDIDEVVVQALAMVLNCLEAASGRGMLSVSEPMDSILLHASPPPDC